MRVLAFVPIYLGLAGFLADARTPARAGEPAPVTAEKKVLENEESCEKPVEYKPDFVKTADFNGDGAPDYVIDYGETNCLGFCGSAGCVIVIYVSQGGGHKKAFDQNVRGWRARRKGGKDMLVVDFHGNACNKAGYEPCQKSFAWNGKKFAPTR